MGTTTTSLTTTRTSLTRTITLTTTTTRTKTSSTSSTTSLTSTTSTTSTHTTTTSKTTTTTSITIPPCPFATTTVSTTTPHCPPTRHWSSSFLVHSMAVTGSMDVGDVEAVSSQLAPPRRDFPGAFLHLSAGSCHNLQVHRRGQASCLVGQDESCRVRCFRQDEISDVGQIEA